MHKFLAEADCPSIDVARDAHPEAHSVIEVDGGFAVFETADDERVWHAQQ